MDIVNIGDKVVCKKLLSDDEFKWLGPSSHRLVVGKSYMVTGYLGGFESSDSVIISGMEFRLYKDAYVRFNNHFYTKNDIRKLKLKRINEL